MQFSKSIALAMLAASSMAQEHHLHRRNAEAEANPGVQYVTVVNTHYVTAGHQVAPTTSSEIEAVSTSAAAAVTTSPETAPGSTSTSAAVTTSPEAVATTEASSSPVVATSSSSSSPAASTEASSSSSTAAAASIGSAGALGITYSPYSNSGGCKSSSEIASEVAKLSGYSALRLYGTDCNQVSAVHSAKAANQQLFLGVYDVGNINSELQAMHDALNGDWSSVNTVSIGNELVNNGQATVDQIKGYLATARPILKSLGYTGPVVSVDTFIAVINNPGLCDLSDYMAVNAHAFFDGGVTSSQAGEWVNQQIQRVWGACSGNKKVTIVESGWPSQGSSNGKATASTEDQQKAISSIKSAVGDDCYLFTAFNDLWKSPGYLNVEQWWGLYGSSAN